MKYSVTLVSGASPKVCVVLNHTLRVEVPLPEMPPVSARERAVQLVRFVLACGIRPHEGQWLDNGVILTWNEALSVALEHATGKLEGRRL